MLFDIHSLTLGQIAEAIAVMGVICGFLFKLFSIFGEVKKNKSDIEDLKEKIKAQEDVTNKQKEELIEKVEETNSAVNLLCLGLSALIDDALNENSDKESLRAIKRKLDERKEIV